MDTTLVQYSTTGIVVGPIANLGDDPVRSPGLGGTDNPGLGQSGSAREEGVFRLGEDLVEPKGWMEYLP